MPNRMEKVDELMKREISKELLLIFPGEIISVTQVTVSPDLSSAKVWITGLKDEARLVRDVQRHAREISHAVAGKVVLKKMPRLYFTLDKTGDQFNRVEHLLEEIKKEKDKE